MDKMAAQQPMPGPGCSQWNAGGWFGGQIGGTAWLLVGAVVLSSQAPGVAALWLVGFAISNAVGLYLWRGRDRIRPYPALQILLAMLGVTGLLALIALDMLGPEGVRMDLVWENGGLRLVDKGSADTGRAYLFLLVFVPLLMAWFHWRDRSARLGTHT
jgi:hypothetical protein